MFTRVENLIIKPHARYEARKEYPETVILCHHTDYLKLAQEIATDSRELRRVEDWKYAKPYQQKYTYRGIPFILDDARDNAKDTIRHAVQHYFWGARRIINIGAAGGVHPDLSVGDYVVGDRAIRDNGLDFNLATRDEEAVSDSCINNQLFESINRCDSGGLLTRGDIWSVGNKYYTWDTLNAIKNEGIYAPKAVEMEMASLCIIVGWLNANYSREMGAVSVGNLFYLSDVLPQSPQDQWVDGMIDLDALTRFKGHVLLSAINALSELST